MEAQATVCITVDNLGRALEIGTGAAVRPDPDEPGLRYGVPRMLDLFAEHGVRATFFVEGWNALHHAGVLARIVQAGHEIGLHGWVHEKWEQELDSGQRERLLFDGTAALAMAGIRPRGFRAPGGYRGERTAAVLAELGYWYDSSIERASENDPLRVTDLPEGIVNVPYHWDANDYWQYHMNPAGNQTSAQALAHWLRLLDEVAASGGLLNFIFHPFVSAAQDDDRYAALRAVVRRAVEDPRLEVLGAEDVATRACLERWRRDSRL